MDTKTILITGGDGFTGQHASEHFKKQDYNVIATSRKKSSNDTIKINLLEENHVFNMIKQLKPQYILHLAGQNDVQSSWKDPYATLEANVLMTLNILEAVRQFQSKAKVIVVGSTLEENLINPSHSHPYSLSKALQVIVSQRWADYFGLHIVIAKPVNLIGPGFSKGVCATFAKQVAKMEKQYESGRLTILNRSIKRDFLDVRDAVQAYDILFHEGKKGETYEIGTGQLRSLVKIAKIYQQLATVTVELDIKNNFINETIYSIDNTSIRALNWCPRYTLCQSLTDCLKFYRRCGGDQVG